MEKQQIKKILARLEQLEAAVFSRPKKFVKTKAAKLDFSGTKGGVLFLITKGYFSQRRTAPDVKTELSKNDYHYSIQVVQTTLNRMATGTGELVALKDGGGKKVYVKRK